MTCFLDNDYKMLKTYNNMEPNLCTQECRTRDTTMRSTTNLDLIWIMLIDKDVRYNQRVYIWPIGSDSISIEPNST